MSTIQQSMAAPAAVAPVAASTPSDGYLAALWRGAPLLPWVAAIVTVLVYLVLPSKAEGPAGIPADPLIAITAGLGATVLAGVLLSAWLRPMSCAAEAQPRLYAELVERSRQLSERLVGLSSGGPAVPLAEARSQLAVADELLTGRTAGPALRWALAHGYVSALRALHRAEETLIMAEPPDALLGEALHDQLSVKGSTIAGRDRLEGILRTATHSLSTAASEAFLPPEAGTQQRAVGPLGETVAKEAIREVRHAINTFRDDARDGLIRARNRLIWTILAVAAVTYLLVGLVLVAHVATVTNVGAASGLFLVGAIVGLFDRLRIEASRSSAVEDFGLHQGRLAAAPLLSGLAAVGGVYLVAIAPALLPAPGGSGGTGVSADLVTVFDLATNPLAVVYAAIFGLAPGTLTNKLRAQADRLERDLLTSQPASATDSADAKGDQS